MQRFARGRFAFPDKSRDHPIWHVATIACNLILLIEEVLVDLLLFQASWGCLLNYDVVFQFPTFFCTGDQLSRYDPLDIAHNHSYFELKWKKTPRMVDEGEDKCFQVRRGGRTYHDIGVNIQVAILVFIMVIFRCNLGVLLLFCTRVS